MITVFEYLPDEILLIVFCRLHPSDLFLAFQHLNTRFDTLLHDYRLFQYVRIDSDRLTSHYTKYIIEYAKQNNIIKTITATVRCRWLDISSLNNLHKLILFRPSQEQQYQFRNLIEVTENFPQLKQLIFVTRDDTDYISKVILTGIFPRLIQCHLYRWHNEKDYISSNFRCENLQSLTINILTHLNIAMHILISLPNLVTFRVNNFRVTDTSTDTTINYYKHQQLKYFHIRLSNWNGSGYFHDYCKIFNRVLPMMPKLRKFSIQLRMICSLMNTDSAIGILLLLSAIGEHLPLDCCFDCNLLCQTSEKQKPWLHPCRSYWNEKASMFIATIKRIKDGLAKKHPVFFLLQCRRVSKQYVEVYIEDG